MVGMEGTGTSYTSTARKDVILDANANKTVNPLSELLSCQCCRHAETCTELRNPPRCHDINTRETFDLSCALREVGRGLDCPWIIPRG